jgi:lipoate---protein ligase
MTPLMDVLCVDIPPSAPPEFLAWEEALLDSGECGGPEVLWFWESTATFVVVGYGQQVAREVHVDACNGRGIPILRRCSGGGTVVQGKGCLNYGVVLHLEDRPELATITGTNRFVLERLGRALSPLLGVPVAVQGHTDLVRMGPGGVAHKFSGNAQRRMRRAVLFHGTLLLDLDLDLLTTLLPAPSWEPPYREGRPHGAFVVNSGLDRGKVRAALAREWGATGTLQSLPEERYRQAMDARYGRPEWHLRR